MKFDKKPKANISTKNVSSLIAVRDEFETPIIQVQEFITVEKPRKEEFFRVHPDESYHFNVLVYESQHRPTHLVDPCLEETLKHFIKRKKLMLVITRNGELKLFPVDENSNSKWAQSSRDAIKRAQKDWVQLIPVRAKASNIIRTASGDLSQPQWPNLSPGEVFTAAFDGLVIDGLEHPIARMLRGDP